MLQTVFHVHIPADHELQFLIQREHHFRTNVNAHSGSTLNTSPLLSGNSVQHPGITVHIHRNHP